MNTLLSIITFPIFFALWSYCKFAEYILIPLHMSLLQTIVRFKPPMKFIVWLGYPSIYLFQSQTTCYQILVGNKDLWWVWVDLFEEWF